MEGVEAAGREGGAPETGAGEEEEEQQDVRCVEGEFCHPYWLREVFCTSATVQENRGGPFYFSQLVLHAR